jgi:hypothetical protein
MPELPYSVVADAPFNTSIEFMFSGFSFEAISEVDKLPSII